MIDIPIEKKTYEKILTDKKIMPGCLRDHVRDTAYNKC